MTSLNTNFAAAAALMGDPVRAAMLGALLEGESLAAGELARAGRITPQTASFHLARLVEGGLLVPENRGRHRYFRLAGPHVAQAIERLCAIDPSRPPRRKALSREARQLQGARRCYDHLAGRLGVAITQRLLDTGALKTAPRGRFEVTPGGRDWFMRTGIDVDALKPSRAGMARQCLDWTERVHHLGGPLGVALLGRLCANGWLGGQRTSRAIEVTPAGRRELRHVLGLDVDHIL